MSELPQKIGDELVMPEPPERLSAVALRELAVDVVEGRVFMTNTEEGIKWSFGLLVEMVDLSSIAAQVGAIYESYSKASTRGINGYPFFTSMRLLHVDDLPLVLNAAAEYEGIRETFVETS